MEEFKKVGREMLEVQGCDGNWDCDEYMHGMYNGMEFMLSLAEGREPVFREAPKKWKRESKTEKFFRAIFFMPKYKAVAASKE